MSLSELSAFIEKVQNDEELMTKVVDANKQENSAAYLVELGASEGFEFTVDNLLEEDPDFKDDATSNELDDEELSLVAGGFGLAKNLKISPRKTMIARMARVMNARLQGKAFDINKMGCFPGTTW
ncbi:Nif11-like leader peptide family RiPP precursor [Synechococcus sp. MIT S1220]|uniref:Nif11-like leader peptide family RiPP precursor n=1 Tax=Synechococcus sp. MIT S1220 TaxID=3082549 RepID=UPI0039AECEBA